jgi:cell division protein FtsZ
MEAADENAEIIFGTVIDNNCGENVMVTVIATGLGGQVRAVSSTTTTNATTTMNSFATAQEVQQVSSTQQVAQAQVQVQAQTEVYTQTATATAKVEEVRDIFAPRRSTNIDSIQTETVEDRSDFDRFMSDRNDYNTQHANQNEDAVTHNNNKLDEGKQPSRLIQSIRDAANRYETSARPTPNIVSNKVENETNNRAKSIAEKLGFINFDEDEFDTPSYLRKEEKTEQPKPATKDFKNFDL